MPYDGSCGKYKKIILLILKFKFSAKFMSKIQSAFQVARKQLIRDNLFTLLRHTTIKVVNKVTNSNYWCKHIWSAFQVARKRRIRDKLFNWLLHTTFLAANKLRNSNYLLICWSFAPNWYKQYNLHLKLRENDEFRKKIFNLLFHTTILTKKVTNSYYLVAPNRTIKIQILFQTECEKSTNV